MPAERDDPAPKKAIRRFDVFAEVKRLEALAEGRPEDEAKGYGVWIAKVVASLGDPVYLIEGILISGTDVRVALRHDVGYTMARIVGFDTNTIGARRPGPPAPRCCPRSCRSGCPQSRPARCCRSRPRRPST